MNSSGAVGEPSSSSFPSVADLHGVTECCESSSPNIPLNAKRSIDEDHRGEINEYDVQKRIKRPMNAFMVWSQMRRAQIASTDVKMHNSQISKELGAEWREMSAEEKAPYVKRAKELREELMRRHPNYVYRPKRRSHGATKNLLTKTCAMILPTTTTAAATTGPSMLPSSFEQRSHSLSSIPTAHDIRRFFIARVMQEQQNNMLLAAYRNHLLAAATNTTAAAPLKDSATLDCVDQEVNMKFTFFSFFTFFSLYFSFCSFF
uniref:Sex-determining region Y protein n=1 Tax=Brugia malayi TaxID=6279 RepID=A0A0H5S0T1_BRUMA|nr:BMA-SOX-4 [Brugia malayi]